MRSSALRRVNMWPVLCLAMALHCAAEANANSHGAAVHVLDPAAACAFDLSGLLTLNINGGRLQVNSSNVCAACNANKPHVVASHMFVTGGSCLADGVFQGELHAGAAPRPDPLMILPAPPNGPARVSPSFSGTQSILPGYYPNGIRKISGSLTMAPGIYVVESQGFQVTGGDVTGDGVMIYIKTGPLDLRGNGHINLTPLNPVDHPAITGSDIYEHVTLFQSRTNTTIADMNGTNNFNIAGTLYLPNNLLRLGGTSDGIGNQIIASTLMVFGTGTLTVNYNGTFPGPACNADVNRSQVVDIADLLAVIAAWGTPGSDPADVNGDGIVNMADVLAVIAAWGACV